MKQEEKKKLNKKEEEVKEETKASILAADEKPADKKSEKESKKKEAKPAVTEVKAKARYIRISPKKAGLVVAYVRGLQVELALKKLALLNKGAAPIVAKLLKSAIANAENNFQLKREDLYIKHIVANQGPTLHRWMPAAFGSAHAIRKRSTHLEVILAVKEAKEDKKAKDVKPTKQPKAAKAKTAKPKKSKEVTK